MVSSPVFTSAVVAFGLCTSASPRRNRAAPTPPASTTTELDSELNTTAIERTARVVVLEPYVYREDLSSKSLVD